VCRSSSSSGSQELCGMPTHTYSRIHPHTHIYTHTHTCIHTHTHAYTHTHTYIYIYIHTHTNKHTNKHKLFVLLSVLALFSRPHFALHLVLYCFFSSVCLGVFRFHLVVPQPNIQLTLALLYVAKVKPDSFKVPAVQQVRARVTVRLMLFFSCALEMLCCDISLCSRTHINPFL
jgi:hypothetical protein